MENLSRIFLRHATAGVDHISYLVRSVLSEQLGDVIDRKNRIFAQKVHIDDPTAFKMSCYHEAGEALIQNFLFPKYPTTKICLIETAGAYGYSFDDMHKIGSRTRTQMIHQMASMFGGYCAEKLVFGDTTEGCEEDFDDIRELVKEMIQNYKMADELIGPIEIKTRKSFDIMGLNVFSRIEWREMKLSRKQQAKYEKFAKNIMDEAENLAISILSQNREKLDALAKAVMAKRVLLTNEIADILEPMERRFG